MPPELDPRPLVGLTGARFGTARRRGVERPAPPDPPPAPAPDDPIGQTGARFGGARRRRRRKAEPAPVRIEVPAVVDDPGIPVQRSTASVRPYVLTRGRTRSSVVLSLETVVSTAPQPGARLPRTVEHRTAVELCREPRSVAEVAARLGVPLGVAGVLLGDLATAGLLMVHGTAAAHATDPAVLERVLHGLRRL